MLMIKRKFHSFKVLIRALFFLSYSSSFLSADPILVSTFGNLSNIKGLAVDPALGRLYVSHGNQVVFSPLTGFNTIIGINPTLFTSLTNPSSIAIDPSIDPSINRVWILNYGIVSRVSRFSGGGLLLSHINVPGMPHSLSINSGTSRLYLTDLEDDNIQIFDTVSLSSTHTPIGGLSSPRGVAYNPTNNKIYVANAGASNIGYIDASSNPVNFSDFFNINNGLSPVSIASIGDRVWALEQNNNNLQTFTAEGSYIATTNFSGVSAIAVSPTTGQLFVADSTNNLIKNFFDPNAWVQSGTSVLPTLTLNQNLSLDSISTLKRQLRVSTTDASGASIGGNGILTLTGGSNSATTTLDLQDTAADNANRLVADRVILNTNGILSLSGGQISITNKLGFNGGALQAHNNYATPLAPTQVTVDTGGGSIQVDSGVTLQIPTSITKAVSGAGTLTKLGTGNLQLTSLYTGSMAINEGSVAITTSDPYIIGQSNGDLTLGTATTPGMLQFLSTSSINIGLFRNTILNVGGGIFDIAADTLAAPGMISGDGAFTKQGLGTASIVYNTIYKGGTSLADGTLQIGASDALPIPQLDPLFPNLGDVTIGSNGTLDLSIYSQTIKRLSGTGVITSSAYDPTYLSTLTLTPDSDTTFAGKIQDGTGNVAVVINSPGVTQTFSGVNPFSGGLTVTAGMVAVAPTSLDPSDPILGTGNITMQDNTALYWNSNATLNNTFTLNPGNPNNQGITMDTGGNTGILGQAITVLGKLIKKGIGKLKLLVGGQNSGILEIQEGTFTTEGDLTNNVGATISNSGTFNNISHLFNYGNFTNNVNSTLNAGDGFSNSGTLTNNGVMTSNFFGNEVGANLTNNGTITYSVDTIINNNGNFNNNANAIVNNNGNFSNNVDSNFNNSGTLNNASFYNDGTFINNQNGIINNNSVFANRGTFTNNAGATINNLNLFENDNGATLNNAVNARIQNNGTFVNRGSLTGNGSFLLKEGTFQDLNSAIVDWSILIDSLGGTITSGDQTHPNNVLTLNNTITDNDPLNPGLLTLSEPGTIVLNGASDYKGGTSIANSAIVQVGSDTALGSGEISLEGTLQAGQDALTLDNDISLGSSSIIDNKGYALTFSGNFLSPEEGNVEFIDSSVAQNGTTTLSGMSIFTKKLITQSTQLTNSGSMTLDNSTILQNDNQFTNTGTITIDSGSVSNKSTFINTGEITNNDRFYNFETLRLEANSKFTGTGSLNLSGSTVIFNGPGIQFNNNIAINPDYVNSLGVTLFVAQGVTQSINNVISSPNGPVSLTKDNLGTLALNGANTYSGQTILSSRTLQVGHNSALGASTLQMLNNTALQFGIGGLVINNPLVLDSGNSVNPGVATIDTGGFFSTLSGAITQIGASVMKLIIQGGNILNLNNVASHEGTTEIGLATTIKAGISNIFGGVNKSLTLLGAGSIFDMEAGNQIIGALQGGVNSQLLLGSRKLTLTQPSTFDGVFSGIGGNIIAKADLALGGQSTNTGLFTIDASVNPVTMTMKVNSSLAAGSSLSLIGSGANSAVFDIKLSSQTISELNGNEHSLIELGNQKLTFGTNNDSVFKGEIQGTNASVLVKQGSGTATFEGINQNYQGITSVVLGRLVLKDPLSAGTGILQIETNDSPSIGNSAFVNLDFSGQNNQHSSFNNSIKGTGVLNVPGSYIDITGDNSDFEGTLAIGGSVFVTEQKNLGQSTINLSGLLALSPQGDFTFNNRLIAPSTGSLVVSMQTPQNIFKFDDISHGFPSQFEGSVVLEQGAFDISGRNTEALSIATLNLSSNGTAFLGGDPGNPMTQSIRGLTFSGGLLSLRPSGEDIFPADTLTVDKLDLSSELNGTIQITIPNRLDPPEEWNGHNKPLLMQDDVILSQFIKANQINRSNVSNSLRLVDQNGDIISAEREIDIDEGAQRVAKGFYDYGVLVKDDGLYLSYGLQKLELQDQQTTVFGGDHQEQGASEFHAQLTGQGNVEIDATQSITLNNQTNDFTGTTSVKTGELILGSDHSLGNTSDLILKEETKTNLFGTTQTVGALHTEARSSLNFNGGNLSVEQGGVVQSKSLSGSGSLNIQGGSFQVNGTNQVFSAATIIENGAEVVLSDPHGLGTSQIENNGQLKLQGHANIIDNIFGNDITGSGNFIIEDADVKLLGNNQHTGSTEIKDSVVSISSDNNLGDAAGEVKLDNATLKFDSSVALPGTRILTLDNGTVIDTQNYSSSINGEINGLGVLTKKGVNRLSINGDKNFTGTINVDSGELKVNGDIVNATVNVVEGSTFSGNNTILNLLNRGILAPGNSIGQIQVINDFNNTGGIYQCEVNDAGQSDLIAVGATATLHGTLQLIPMAGNYQLNQPYIYTILTSINPIITKFDTVNGVSPLFSYDVIYNPLNVQLRMIRTSSLGQTITEGNAGIVAQNLEKINTPTGTLQTAFNHLMGLNKNQSIDALNRFDTASTITLNNSLASNFFNLGETLSNTLHNPLERSILNEKFKKLVKSIKASFKTTMDQLFSSSALSSKKSTLQNEKRVTQVPYAFHSQSGQSSIWSHSVVTSFTQDHFSSPGTFLPEMKTTTGNTQFGFDHQVTDNVLLGVMAGVGRTSYRLSDNYGDGKVNSYHIGTYSSVHITPEFYIDTLVSYGFNNLKGNRKINFSGFEAETSQKHHVHQFGGIIDTGYEIFLPSNFILTPMAGIGILTLKEEGYREIGADTLGLNVKGQRRTYFQNKFGAQLAKYFKTGETQFYGFIRGAYTYRKGLKNAHKVTSSFIGQLPDFTVVGDKQNHNFFSPAVGLTALFKNDVYISIGYNGDLGKKQKSHEGFFKIGYKF